MSLVIDTGVLYALLDRSDAAHVACRDLLVGTKERRLLPSPILPEVDYWVAKQLGATAMVALLRDINAGAFEVVDVTKADYQRIEELVEQYGDMEIGFVDASVIAIVERLGERKVATLDRRHFGAVRPRHARSLKLVP